MLSLCVGVAWRVSFDVRISGTISLSPLCLIATIFFRRQIITPVALSTITVNPNPVATTR